MAKLEELKNSYPGALAWKFGDSPELADELVQLVLSGRKTATCSSIASFHHEHERGEAPCVGSYNIILNGAGQPMCVIRTLRMQVIRFNEMTSELASKEGEGDLSLEYWNEGHKRYFEREGTYSEEMELIFEEFELTEIL
ncbi:ASCH domain-containing protein (plasmid) [Klebsiella pneumoniae]|uniref:ASCH domain-containing protein n=1 Tax=Enterobacteriaceae TaxID=543 RepID=UPI000E34A124|nr:MULTISPECIES: ASCH domain-containing protein [Enterobacteriaceae]HDS8009161.1 ASCH domain-containing protein [Klebsiella pneumoniae subsp. pneumoniae]MBC4476629.1 ASCH domain-containing protein [Klebsiella pneumoniae]MCD9688399.1 ASCH domain-containing protein [Klebsiella variicola subsp. variicola]MCD9837915.1 ASCH domain-containing protein [Klebsiella variicola subsp. variicola]MCW3931119.1 ASCH domain-containing protein [Escherichia coli]